MRKIRLILLLFLLIGGLSGWLLTAPNTLPANALDGLVGDIGRGERVFNLGGCASCHAAPKSTGDARLVLSGGVRLPSPFGTFIAPNISPDPVAGIGDWSTLDLANAMRFGTSPDGAHYFPAFPYTSYARAPLGDIVDLKAYLDTLPPSPVASLPHEVGFPFNIRRSVGGWKLLFFSSNYVVPSDNLSPLAQRGRAMVEGMAHCAECHTARGPLGNLRRGEWLKGAPNPTGKGRIPSLASGKGGLSWSASDIAYYLKSGFTPEYDTAGAQMADVVENMSKLSDDDLAAIAAYLKELP
jgi:mono/diheme cytochrome c family protein